MKVLVGYDGSESGKAVFDDLERAGLPRQGHLRVVSVADLTAAPSPVSEFDLISASSQRVETALRRAENHRQKAIEDAKVLADEGADRLRAGMSDWMIDSVAREGAPAWEIIDDADEWGADLVVVGSHGRSAIGRLLLGSVSKRIATDAKSSVRIARPVPVEKGSRPPRIIVGVDGSPAAEEAIYEVGRRLWQDGTEIRLVTVDDSPSTGRIGARLPLASAMINSYFQSKDERVSSMLDWAVEQFNAVGIGSSINHLKGDPKKALLEEADRWKADSIFLGTRDLKGIMDRLRLGSVSTAVAINAGCSVEIVRPPAINGEIKS